MGEEILLVGCGQMGLEYAKILESLKRKFVVVGRSKKSAENFEKITGKKAFQGGIDKWLSGNTCPPWAIVAVSENELGSTVLDLIRNGAKHILVEKPGGSDYGEIEEIASLVKNKKTDVYVGYNRRFYASVGKAIEIVKEDGGIFSFNFEFTERSHIISGLVKAPGVKENWFLHNSTHVIDLAFFLGGKPVEISSYVKGSLDWHPRGSVYTGSGITTCDALFSYQANWSSPGRWGLELMTKKHRLILKPLEKLQIQNIGSFDCQEVEIDDRLDRKFKPGLYKQVESFLSDNRKNLCSLQEQRENIQIYKKIEGIKNSGENI